MRSEKVETLHVSVGYTCNNACRFCMEADKQKRYQLVKKFIATRHMYREMDKHQGIQKIGFGRGEPTLNPDLSKYVAYAKKKGFKEIAVISNGRQYQNKELCLKLVRSGVTEFIVSLHGHTKELHEAMTRGENSFSETTQGLKNLSELKKKFPFRIVISHVVNKVNYKFMGNFLKFMQKFSIDEILLGVVRPYDQGGMKQYFSALMPRYSEVGKVVKKLLKEEVALFSRNGQPYVTINDLPICVAGTVALEYLGIRRDWVSGNDEPKEKVDLERPYKHKNVGCKKCLYEKVCVGIFDNYTNYYGWSEFKPVKQNKH